MTTTIQIDPLETIPTLPREPHPHRERLLKAAALIEQRGWCTGNFKDDSGRLCIRGAWYEAEGELEYSMYANKGWWHPLGCADEYSVASLELEALPGWAADWNNGLDDNQGRSLVVEALRRVADGETWDEVTNYRGENW